MLPRLVPLVAATSIVLASITGHAGGWAVVSVEDLPGHFTVGQPTELKFGVRQHGMRLVPNLQPANVIPTGLLSVMLTNPAMIPKRDVWEMPDLKLRPPEVAALVAFINKRRTQD